MSLSQSATLVSSPIPLHDAVTQEHSQGFLHRKHWKENVLSLDGGGIRGYATLQIINAIMAEVRIREQREDAELRHSHPGPHYDPEIDPLTTRNPLPCHYFDYVVGTSTGGLIAIMLGRLRMTVVHCLEEYKELGDEVFGKRRLLYYYRYSHKKLQKLIKSVVRRFCEDVETNGRGDDMMYQNDADGTACRTAVLAVEKRPGHEDQLHAFTSYFPSIESEELSRRRISPSDPKQVYIHDAGRATSAAPGFFQEAKVNGQEFMDGAVLANNPSWWAWHEAWDKHRKRRFWLNANGYSSDEGQITHQTSSPGCPIGVFVSLGTGLRAPQSAFHRGDPLRRIRALLRKAVSNMTDCEKIHDDMRNLTAQHNFRFYYRFNPPGLEKMRLDQCRSKHQTFREMENTCSYYLQGAEVQRQIRECAAELVRQRRSRCSPDELLRFHDLTQRGPRNW